MANLNSILIFLFTAMVSFAFSCATSPTGRKQLIIVSDQEMNLMGGQAFGEMKEKLPIDRSTSANLYVKCIVHALAPFVSNSVGADTWEVVVFKNKEANAFALPGGKIGVQTGMFAVAKTPGQLAAVIGHEIGHVIARHGAERVSTSLAAQSGLMVADALMGDRSSKKNVMAALGLGTQFGVILPHGRTQESEADRIGLDLMAEAGFDPRESIDLWNNMSQSGGSSAPEFLSTHPSNSRRIADIESSMGPALSLFEAARKSGRSPKCHL